LVAVGNHDIPSIKNLLEYNSPFHLPGRVIKRREEFYYTPYELALHYGYFDVVELLHSYGYNLSQYPYLADPYNTSNIPVPLQQNKAALSMLQRLAFEPPSLFQATILSIRKCLRRGLHDKVKLLPLPAKLERDLLCLAV
jgi:ankyrin repeat protein